MESQQRSLSSLLRANAKRLVESNQTYVLLCVEDHSRMGRPVFEAIPNGICAPTTTVPENSLPMSKPFTRSTVKTEKAESLPTAICHFRLISIDWV
ncbi:hypothetical protein E4U60_005621 [Claviceps pazoutovae]|uniref:Uncharacterized protein n=1 Tax=Claviceps pazoutovae TaxID=1649127 RepID=A0A9P7MHM3_9HYPO|nr:hypothetical protein E4U60_005621 [Claviceps pazoutovae]